MSEAIYTCSSLAMLHFAVGLSQRFLSMSVISCLFWPNVNLHIAGSIVYMCFRSRMQNPVQRNRFYNCMYAYNFFNYSSIREKNKKLMTTQFFFFLKSIELVTIGWFQRISTSTYRVHETAQLIDF